MIVNQRPVVINTVAELDTAIQGLVLTGAPIPALVEASFLAQAPGSRAAWLNSAIHNSNAILFDYMPRADILVVLRSIIADLRILVNTTPATYTYTTHGDKHFPGGAKGTKFHNGANTVNPMLITEIASVLGRIRRQCGANNLAQIILYYTMRPHGIPIANQLPNGCDLCIQLEYHVGRNEITYHGYPDATIVRFTLSEAKGGDNIAQ